MNRLESATPRETKTTSHVRERTPKNRFLTNPILPFVGIVGVIAAAVMSLGWYCFEFDRALLMYAVAGWSSLVITTYRMFSFLERPPTRRLCSRALVGLQNRSRWTVVGFFRLTRRMLTYFGGNQFIWHRARIRWGAHWPIMFGTLMALSIVVPLILGWVWFESDPNNIHMYRILVWGWHVRTFAVESWEAFLIFHGLVWASIPVVVGVAMALSRRIRDRGDRATQTFAFDILPLIALLAVALSGILLTISTTLWHGTGHSFIAWVHYGVVVLVLLWLPDSKFIHIPQRVVKVAEIVCRSEFVDQRPAICGRCREPFAPQWQINDLKQVESDLGHQWNLGNDRHYQDICPRCRRVAMVLARN